MTKKKKVLQHRPQDGQGGHRRGQQYHVWPSCLRPHRAAHLGSRDCQEHQGVRVIKLFYFNTNGGSAKKLDIVKNMFGFSILYCLAFNVNDKSYRQVLIPINNSQLLLKLEIQDKVRLVTNQQLKHKGNCNIF